MKNARKQKYCTGYAPLELTNEVKMTCRKYAAKQGQKELAENDPIVDIYTRRCSCIRAEKSNGKIDADLAEAAKAMAKELMYKFRRDDNYTLESYERDMKKDNLYALAKKNML